MVDVKLPRLGASMTDADIVEWLKRPGDRVQVDDELVRIESIKASDVATAPVAGRPAEILAPAGDTVKVGAVLARIDEMA